MNTQNNSWFEAGHIPVSFYPDPLLTCTTLGYNEKVIILCIGRKIEFNGVRLFTWKKNPKTYLKTLLNDA